MPNAARHRHFYDQMILRRQIQNGGGRLVTWSAWEHRCRGCPGRPLSCLQTTYCSAQILEQFPRVEQFNSIIFRKCWLPTSCIILITGTEPEILWILSPCHWLYQGSFPLLLTYIQSLKDSLYCVLVLSRGHLLCTYCQQGSLCHLLAGIVSSSSSLLLEGSSSLCQLLIIMILRCTCC
jgi:hypothetical protein